MSNFSWCSAGSDLTIMVFLMSSSISFSQRPLFAFSTLAMALAAGSTLEQAIHLANLTAGIVVGKRGTATVTLDELREAALPDGTPSETAAPSQGLGNN